MAAEFWTVPLTLSLFLYFTSAESCTHFAAAGKSFDIPLEADVTLEMRIIWKKGIDKIYDSRKATERKTSYFIPEVTKADEGEYEWELLVDGSKHKSKTVFLCVQEVEEEGNGVAGISPFSISPGYSPLSVTEAEPLPGISREATPGTSGQPNPETPQRAAPRGGRVLTDAVLETQRDTVEAIQNVATELRDLKEVLRDMTSSLTVITDMANAVKDIVKKIA